MRSFEEIETNFRFMLVQVEKQLDNTALLLDAPDTRIVQTIQRTEEYIDTQKSMIENDCFALLSRTAIKDEREADSIRALHVITSNLERIADFAVNICGQVQHLRDRTAMQRFAHRPYLDALRRGVGILPKALFTRDSDLALQICKIEDETDRLYAAHFQEIIAALRGTQEVEDLLTVLFILHYLERMGDALLNIGEGVLFAALGERLKIRQYRILDEAVTATPEFKRSIADVELASIWGTRSGVRIGKLENPDAARNARRVLFKQGDPSKLQRERDSLERWVKIAPGLVPEVVEFQQEHQEGAALLLQYLDGATLQDLTLNAETPVLQQVLDRLTETLSDLWTRTRADQPANGEYLGQLHHRLDDVYRLHPELRGGERRIGAVRVPAFATLLQQAETLDAELPSPFSVFIHGDFNLDNIIYNPKTDTIHFVDVQRSRQMDYAQDVSVFLVSSFRMPVFEPATRNRLEQVALAFLRFARDFAARQGDTTFEGRLALGLVRSFTTSTRFELNRRFARTMQQRAALLLHKLLESRSGAWAEFHVPDNILVY